MRVLRGFCLLACWLALTSCLASCVAPNPDDGAYRVDALRTVQAARGSVATTLMVVDTALADRIFGTSADVIVTQAVADLASVTGTFSAIEPPPPGDELAETVDEATATAQSACRDALISLRRGDRPSLQEARQELIDSGTRLEELENDLSGQSGG